MTQHAHHGWLAEFGEQIQRDYEGQHAAAAEPSNVQRAGHGAESTWVRFLQAWLPPAYEVVSRKYILGENADSAHGPPETDVVVLRPGYPTPLRQREEVLAGGVAAAFSVKLTLDSAGLREAAEQAVKIKRTISPRLGTPRGEIESAFPFGLLAHSHGWKAPGSQPETNLVRNLLDLDAELVQHPREMLDLVCVADLAAAHAHRMTYMPAFTSVETPQANYPEGAMTSMLTSYGVGNPPPFGEENPSPVAIFVASLLVKLSSSDPTLIPITDGLRQTNTLGSGRGTQRHWTLTDVFTEQVEAQIRHRVDRDRDWMRVYMERPTTLGPRRDAPPHHGARTAEDATRDGPR